MKKKIFNSRFVRSIVEKKGIVTHTSDVCVFCGKCAKICGTGSISVNRKEKTLVIDHGKCMRCGQCAKACPKSALKIEKSGGGV